MPKGTNVNRIKNKKVQVNNTSGYTGISYHKGRDMWYARICFRGKTYSLGYYDKIEDAVRARKRAEELTFDDFIETLKNRKTIVV